MVHEQGSHENQREEATHTFESLHPHVFDVQPILLVKAIGVFDTRPVTPLRVHRLGICCGADGEVGEQDKIAAVVRVVGDQCSQHLVCVGEADHQPTQFDIYVSDLTSVGKGDAEFEGQRHRNG